MTDKEILEAYNGMKNAGMLEDDIVQAFKERRGIDLEAMRAEKTLMAPEEMVPYQEEKATQDYYEESATQMERAGEAAWDVLRQVGQGVSFGGSDELEAYIRSKMPDSFGYGDYDEEIKKVNSEINEFKKENPGTAAMAEIAGALMVPGMVVARLGKYLPYVGKIKEGQWLQNILKRATLGGTAGAIDMGLYGYGTGEGGWDSPDRIQNAKNSALIGGSVGMIAGPITGIIDSGVKAISNKMAKKGMSAVDIDGNVLHEGHTAKTDRDSIQFMNDELARGFEGFDDLRKMLNKMIELDPDIANVAQLADLTRPGSNIKTLQQKIGATSPMGRVDALEALENKIESFKPIAEKSIKKFLGKRIGDAPNWLKIFSKKTKQLANPHYKKSDPVMVHSSDLWNEINTLMKRKDDVGKMMRKAYNDTRMEIPTLNEITGIKGNLSSKGLSGEAPINHLHALKLFIKQQHDKMPKPDRKGAEPFASLDAGKMQNIMGKITKFLKSESDDYKKASNIYNSRSEFKDAFELGTKASEKGSKHTGDMVRRELSEMSNPSQNAYRLGYASKMYQRVRGSNVPSPNEEKILKLFETEEKDKLRALYKSPGLFKEFLEKMKIISDMDYQAKLMVAGSKTDAMREMGKRLEGEPGLGAQAANMYNRMRGGPGGMPLEALDQRKVQQRVSGMGPYMNAQGPGQLNEAINRMEAEGIRAANEQQAHALYPSMFPSILAPQEDVRNQNPFGLLGPR